MWQYERPYHVYNIVKPQITRADLKQEIAYFLAPFVKCHAILNGENDLVGYCTFGNDAQVPGGDYSASALEIGLGVRPDLTGRGLGSEFVTAVTTFATHRFQAHVLRVTIAKFNERAQKVWARHGFATVSQFTATTWTKRPFLIMIKSISTIPEE
jgi:RimJ/RimL family protein N-acetyltransferase